MGARLAPAVSAPAPVSVGARGAPASAPVATPAPTPDAPALPPVYSNPFAVQVQATEYALQLSKSAVSPGDVRVEFNLSRAQDPHNLVLVRGDGTGPLYSFDEQPSGAVVSRTLPLSAGRWRLFCSLAGHDAAGMHATLTVG